VLLPNKEAVEEPINAIMNIIESPTGAEEFQSWMCLICGWVYDEEQGLPDEGIAPGTRWADVPINWTCPECGARKNDFEMVAF
jgi:rubredoxin